MANVLITGCGSGFGLLTAEKFAREGHRVFATVRDVGRAGELEAARDAERLPITILPLEVRDAAAVRAAVTTALAAGPLDVLVNNAGYALLGPVEEVGEEEMLAQFETNVFGLVRMIRAVLPGMRERRAGTIVNVSSMGVYRPRPFAGFYLGSKAAVGALSQALHQGLRPFGVRVVLVEASAYPTRFGANRQVTGRASPESPYHTALQQVAEGLRRWVSTASTDPREVADAVYDAVLTEQPRFRCLVGPPPDAWPGPARALASQLAVQCRSGEVVSPLDALGSLLT